MDKKLLFGYLKRLLVNYTGNGNQSISINPAKMDRHIEIGVFTGANGCFSMIVKNDLTLMEYGKMVINQMK